MITKIDKAIWITERKLLQKINTTDDPEVIKIITESLLNLAIASETIDKDYFELIENGITGE